MCFQKNSSRKKLEKMNKFLNSNRIWICQENCIVAPECCYCRLLYQLNYSIKKKNADLQTFQNSVFYNTLSYFEELYEKHTEAKRWVNYNKSFKFVRAYFTISFI